MKGVGGFLDMLTNVLTLLIGFIFIFLGWYGIQIPSPVILILGIAFIAFAIMSFAG